MRPLSYPFKTFHNTPKPNLKARGQTKPGTMNKTEQRYAERLESLRIGGEVAWWAYESVKLRLADNTHYTVDFFVMLTSGELQAHDVKGGRVEDDARVKIKIAAKLYPWRFLECAENSKADMAATGLQWNITEF